MALVEAAGGTQTATLDTEHTLATLTGGKTYVLVVDTDLMVNGDITKIRIYTKSRSGEASKLAYEWNYAHLQDELVKYSIPVPANIEFKATLEQTDGTGRDYVWAVLSID